MTSTSSYSIKWAFSVVKATMDKHARATETTMELLHLSVQQLAFILANRPHQWTLIRNFIKMLEKQALLLNGPGRMLPADDYTIFYTTTWMLSNLKKKALCAKEQSFADYIDTLTPDSCSIIFGELVKRGVEEATPSPPIL